jgi:hypothetical protein
MLEGGARSLARVKVRAREGTYKGIRTSRPMRGRYVASVSAVYHSSKLLYLGWRSSDEGRLVESENELKFSSGKTKSGIANIP